MNEIGRRSKKLFSHNKQVLRNKLIVQITLILLVMGAVAYIVFYLLDMQYRHSFAKTYVERSTRESIQRFQNFIQPLINSLSVARDWGENGLVDLARKDNLTLKFVPLLKRLPSVESVLIGDNNGRYYELKKQSSGWIIHHGLQNNNNLLVNGQILDSTLQIQDQFTRMIEARFSDLEWFRSGLKANKEHHPVNAMDQENSYITVSEAWENDSLVTVLAYKLRIAGFIELMAALAESEGKNTFFFDQNDVLYNNIQYEATDQNINASFIPFPNVSDVAIRSFLNILQENDFIFHEPVRMNIDDQIWWGAFDALNHEQGVLKVGCLINENTIRAEMGTTQVSVYLVFTIGLIAALLLIVLFFKRYTKKMDQLIYRRINNDQIDREIPEIISRGEGPTVEFKSTMRMNLKSGKFGREIEHAWLKTIAAYMNSEGGLLLIGVSDDGHISGLEADQFENDDRCRLHFKNVFNQHIGSELSRYVRMNIHVIGGAKIVIVECDPSPEPAFVKGKNEEEDFYIRSGPSSIKLSVSKSLKYIRAREAESEK